MKNFKNYSKEELLDMIDYEMITYNKPQYEVLRELGLDSRYIGNIRHQLGRQLKKNTSSIQDRIIYCMMILNKNLTIKDVSDITGYHTSTIRNWLKDYKEYGTEMLTKATGFNHYKG